MINNQKENIQEEKEKPNTPDELPAIYVRGFVKITDPESGQVLVETNN